MRKIIAIGIAAIWAAVAAIWGGTVIGGNNATVSSAAPAASPVSVMQMMKDARDLPEQQFDAH
jgi:hypothetical protein